MKVSEVISRLKVGDTVWVKLKADGFDDIGAPLKVASPIDCDYMWLHENAEISLTEPQAEKVVVTEKQAELLRAFKGESIYELLTNCLVEDEELMAKAHLYGYTVKPKRWVVKFGLPNDARYFRKFNGCHDLGYNYVGKKENAHVFTDRAKAEAVATLVEGSVEEI